MPYGSTSELPQAVRDKYSSKCQRAFMHAFNSVYENTHDDGRSSAAGHSAAQRCEANKSAAEGVQMTLVAEAAPAVNDVKFSFHGTGALKSSSSSDGKMRLHGIASSTTKDRHGDVMLESAIDDMVRTAGQNMTIFLNHSYTIPEDIAGSVETVEKRYDGTDALLGLTILIDETNPRAVQAWKSVQAGRQMGISIGANLPTGGYTRAKDGTYEISHVDLLEASLVGVPANPKSWVEYAVKALNDEARPDPGWIALGDLCPSCGGGKSSPRDGCGSSYHTKHYDAETVEFVKDQLNVLLAAPGEDETVEVIELDDVEDVLKESHSELPDSAFACIDKKGRHYPHHNPSGSLNLKLLRNALARIGDASNTQCGKGHLKSHARAAGVGQENDFDDFLTWSDERIDILEAEIDLDEAHEDGSGTWSGPAIETAIVDIHIDTDSSEESSVDVASPEAQESAPEAEAGGLLDEDADGTNELLGDTQTLATEPALVAGQLSLPASEMTSLVDSYARIVKDLMDSRVANAELTAQVTALTGERDQAVRERDRVIAETGALLTRLAEIPLVRKTSVAAAYTDFRARFSGIYDEDFLDLLEKKRYERSNGTGRPE